MVNNKRLKGTSIEKSFYIYPSIFKLLQTNSILWSFTENYVKRNLID